jgi:hypothetical protein
MTETNRTTCAALALTWEPGNATRYDLIAGVDTAGRLFLSWLCRGGGGGVVAFTDFAPHWSYLADKMSAGGLPTEADARALSRFAAALCDCQKAGQLHGLGSAPIAWFSACGLPGKLYDTRGGVSGGLLSDNPGIREQEAVEAAGRG